MKLHVAQGVESLFNRRLRLEGHQIVSEQEAEFVVTNSVMKDYGKPTLRSGQVFPLDVVKRLGFDVSGEQSDFYVTRYFEHDKGWGPQVFLGIPLLGLMDGGISARVETGTVGLYTRSQEVIKHFERDELGVMLKEIKHSGFVSIRMTTEGLEVCGIETGVPSWGLYNIFQGVTRGLVRFFGGPSCCRFNESFTVSLLLTRWPWPGAKLSEPVQIEIEREVEEHFWLGDVSAFGEAISTKSTLIGVATGWAHNLNHAANRALSTCRNVGVKEAQYRTDANWVGGRVLGLLRDLGVIS